MTRLPRIGGGGDASARRRAVAVWGLGLAFHLILSPHLRPATSAEPEAAKYPHKSVKRAEFGIGARSYWIFEPAEPSPSKASVVVLNHGLP